MLATDTGAARRQGPDGPRHKPARAIGADIAQHDVHTVGAERTFIRTDPGVYGLWWQVAITHCAVWAEF